MLNIDLKKTCLLKLKLITVVESAANVGVFYLLDGSPKVKLMVNRCIEKSGLTVDNILIKMGPEAQTYLGRKLGEKENLVIAVFLNKKINLVSGRILGFGYQRIHTSAVAEHPPLQWYVLADKEYGPVTLEKLKIWGEQKRVLPDSLVRKGKGKYKIAKKFLELQLP